MPIASVSLIRGTFSGIGGRLFHPFQSRLFDARPCGKFGLGHPFIFPPGLDQAVFHNICSDDFMGKFDVGFIWFFKSAL